MQNLMNDNYVLNQIINDFSAEKVHEYKVGESEIMLKKAKELNYKSHIAWTKTSMSLANPIHHLHLWSAHPFRPLVSPAVMLTPPLLGWLCPKGQVTRAQEAEENYLVKRELATVKQQSEEAGAQLEQAKKTIMQLQQQQQPHAVRWATEFLAGRLHWLRSCRTGARWHGDWDVSQVKLVLLQFRCSPTLVQMPHIT